MTALVQPGDLGIVKADCLAGDVVHVMQRLSVVTDPGETGWVHVFTVLPGGMVGEAEPGGYVIRRDHYDPADVWYSTDRLPHGPLSIAQRDTICATAQQMEDDHVGYSELDYLAIAAHQWHLWAPGLKSYIASTGHMICSQAGDWLYERAHYQLFADDRWPGFVRPYDLAVLFGAPRS